MNPTKLSIISVDPSLRSTGVYRIQGGDRKAWTIRTKGMDRIEALGEIKNALVRIVKDHPSDIGIVEGYSYGAISRAVTTMAEVGGIVRVILSDHVACMFEIAPMAWKALTIGNGVKKSTKTQKQAYLDNIEQKYHVKIESVDIADAYLMARVVRNMLAGKWTTKTAEAVRQKAKEVFG